MTYDMRKLMEWHTKWSKEVRTMYPVHYYRRGFLPSARSVLKVQGSGHYLKALQSHQSDDASTAGTIAGSFPIFGGYMRAGYPSWATKYFLDALLLQHPLAPLSNQ